MWSFTTVVFIMLGIGVAILCAFVYRGMLSLLRDQSTSDAAKKVPTPVQREELRVTFPATEATTLDHARLLMLDFVESCQQVLLSPAPQVRVVKRRSDDPQVELRFWRRIGVGSLATLQAKLFTAFQPHRPRLEPVDDEVDDEAN